MDFKPTERVALFIDGANLYAAAKNLSFDIDYKKLLRFFSGQARLVRAYYYTALFEDQEFSPIRPLIDWLDYNGFTLVTKPVREYTDQVGRKKVKGNMDIELAVNFLELSDHIDHALLFSGDGDFRGLFEAVQRKGVRCYAVSTTSTNPPMISDDLRRQADEFIDLRRVIPAISRLDGTHSYSASHADSQVSADYQSNPKTPSQSTSVKSKASETSKTESQAEQVSSDAEDNKSDKSTVSASNKEEVN